MVQMSFEGLDKIEIDFTDPALPESVMILRPLLFYKEGGYCCILGPDPQRGVLGCGYSAKEAMSDFDQHLQELRNKPRADDEVSIFVASAYANVIRDGDEPVKP
jgi:hypothetical protein